MIQEYSNCLSPSDFSVNEAWIAIQANDDSFSVQGGWYDCYVLMDAGSAYAFGHVLVRKGQAPNQDEVIQLFERAYGAKSQWASRLIVTGDGPAESAFMENAKLKNMPVETVNTNQLLKIIGPMKESFAEMLKGKA